MNLSDIYRDRYRVLSDSENPAIRSGRSADCDEIESFIWEDIKQKLRFKDNQRILDLGCGCGYIVDCMIDYSIKHNCNLWLMDDSKIIEKIRVIDNRFIHTLKGYFLKDFGVKDFKEKFDIILVYSVLHYADNPERFVINLVKLLSEDGEILIGDIPNQSKKSGLLTSVKGSNLERAYRNNPPESKPLFNSYTNYLDSLPDTEAGISLDDDFLLMLISKLRRLGCDTYLVPQPEKLPYYLTREDLLIRKRLF
jgi:2-polyprenyl-3-methyl-5-hydroxy-6-metoxy-1,4-benzoquinol methylase